MSPFARVVSVVGGTAAVIVAGTAGSAFAAQSLQECMDQAENHGGEPPVCTEVDGGWVASWPDEVSEFDGGTEAFVILFVLAIVASIAILLWKVGTARRLATQSGMDPSLATQMTLLTDNGLESTYLAASLREPLAASKSPAAEQTTAAKRLGELKVLLDDGLITQAEYDEQRRSIIDAI
ncbi:SHOCT domain-containing protein [Aeromicrobium sp. P5_D10]